MTLAERNKARLGWASARWGACFLGMVALSAEVACSSSSDSGGGPGLGGGGSATVGGGAPAVGGAGAAGHAGMVIAAGGAAVGGGGAGTAGGLSAGGDSAGGSAAGSPGSGGSSGGVSMGGRGGTGGGSTAGGAGTAAGAGGGSNGGSSGFDPCPVTGDCKVLPLGDSITYGTPTNNGGYRVELFTKAHADNLHLTFVGTQMDGPAMVAGVAFPKNNEGYPGITTANLDSQHVKSPGTALKDMPQIILLHIGTNNVSQASAATDLEKIIDDIVTALPNSLLAVASIIPLPSSSSAVTSYNAKIPGIVQARASVGKHVIFVDQFADFPTAELTDGVHPTDAKGYPRMGDKWYAAIKPYLH